MKFEGLKDLYKYIFLVLVGKGLKNLFKLSPYTRMYFEGVRDYFGQ